MTPTSARRTLIIDDDHTLRPIDAAQQKFRSVVRGRSSMFESCRSASGAIARSCFFSVGLWRLTLVLGIAWVGDVQALEKLCIGVNSLVCWTPTMPRPSTQTCYESATAAATVDVPYSCPSETFLGFA